MKVLDGFFLQKAWVLQFIVANELRQCMIHSLFVLNHKINGLIVFFAFGSLLLLFCRLAWCCDCWMLDAFTVACMCEIAFRSVIFMLKSDAAAPFNRRGVDKNGMSDTWCLAMSVGGILYADRILNMLYYLHPSLLCGCKYIYSVIILKDKNIIVNPYYGYKLGTFTSQIPLL